MPKKRKVKDTSWKKDCPKRIARNQFGENMCGAIGCCEVGDMPCYASPESCSACQSKGTSK